MQTPKPKLLKCKCSPKGCTHWEVIVHPGTTKSSRLRCITCGDEHNVLISLPKHDKLHIAEHEA